MITLALFRKMANDIDILVKDENFFWEEMPLQKDGKPASGVWLVTRGGNAANSPKGLNLKSTVDFYVAFKNKVQTEAVQQQVLEWILANPCICDMSGGTDDANYDYAFSNIRIRPTTTPQNDGVTENGKIVKMASIELTYDIKN